MAPSRLQTTTAILALLLATLSPLLLHDLVFTSLGVRRTMLPLATFPYACRRIHHALLEACEDMWLDDDRRVLYAACSSAGGRGAWNPSMSKLNVSGRRPGGDHVSALDVDAPGADGLFGVRALGVRGYEGAKGDGSLDLHGFDVEVVGDGERLRFWMVNHRPPVDGEGGYLDAGKVGANSTVEVFDVVRGAEGAEMVHVRTVASWVVETPNKLAVTGEGGVVVTNDHSGKVGLRRQLDPLIGGGNLAYCGGPTDTCHIAASGGFNYPNGIVKGLDGLYYVPSSFVDRIRVMRLHPSNRTLTPVDTIHLGMPVDNLAVDLRTGDLYAAAFPDLLRLLKSFKDPYHVDSPTTVWRIRKRMGQQVGSGSAYEVEKIVEDKEAEVLGGATVARHDSKTGRLFIGGAIAPYITVCDPR